MANLINIPNQSESTVNLSDLNFEGLHHKQQFNHKNLPLVNLYDDNNNDDLGPQLFDKISYLEEYCPTEAEMYILQNKVNKIVEVIEDGSLVVELGSGSLRKSKLILDGIEKSGKKNIEYYAFGVMEKDLILSLESQGTSYKNIKLGGRFGTYNESMEYIKSINSDKPKTILWLGSSISGFAQEEAIEFLKKIQSVLLIGDRLVLGIHHTSKERIKLAYSDSDSVTKYFILDALNYANKVLGDAIIDKSKFSYESEVDIEKGCHNNYYLSNCYQELNYIDEESGKEYKFNIEKDKKIFIECSFQISLNELNNIIRKGKLNLSSQSFHENYSLNILFKPPFIFQSVPNNKPTPTVEEWNELWKAWTYIVTTLITPDMLLMKPISLRHPFIFYLGHIPAFLDIQLKKHFQFELTEPKQFAEYFERGIDPDVDDPTKCHNHSEVPSTWPSLNEILLYQLNVQKRLVDILNNELLTARLARVLSYAFEHQAMHLETLLYMLIRAPKIGPIHKHILPVENTYKNPANKPQLLEISQGEIIIGIDDEERKDNESILTTDKVFGWDNEYPQRSVTVSPFKIQSRPVTNGEYLSFIITTCSGNHPSTWIPIQDTEYKFRVRTLLGPVSMDRALNWPVMCSHDQAQSYAAWKGMRIPTENELLRCKDLTPTLQNKTPIQALYRDHTPNIGFQAWHPLEVTYNSNDWQLFGDGWEWTSTPFSPHPDFEPSSLYPGYSQDFFDGKHMIILGGSYTTHPRLTRRSFRNWYQRSYLYTFATFRCATI